MRDHLSGWLIVAAAVVLQFLMEVTLGRVFVAPAILVPVLVYLSLLYSDYWSIEGAMWSGLVIDLLLHQPPGVSSVAMLSGIAVAGKLLKSTTGVLEVVFVFNALLASVFTDIVFIFLAARPVGSGFGMQTMLIVPRIVFVLLLYPGIPILLGRKNREF